ncbi:hypothetical protein OGAPHI_004079 [Ogataea philodendri]|uniref:ATP-dependent RNA helicase n=1 Tax=Ogataea philodendri TaxID=1378263 RepID=A0A9P8P6E4_9ASCO|nr:uncharacterized protein OGAPHI_004079 [Ogataea philodendri]KAH3665890.1 hypothetical protein OGAPHI_004079 [Ogataea philodendri]
MRLSKPLSALYSTEAPTSRVDEVGLNPKISNAFVNVASENLTEVQSKVVPEMLSTNNGVLVRAKTGTGKTYAFGLPLMNEWITDKNFERQESVHSLIINPTRDLAFQTQMALDRIWKQCGGQSKRRIDLCVGQVKYDQILRGVNGRTKSAAFVATPGRLEDMLNSKPDFRNAFKDLRHFVIDEADVLCDNDFKEALLSIVKTLKANHSDPSKLKVTMFSATMDNNTKELADRLMGPEHKYIDVTSGREVTDSVNQSLITTDGLYETFAVAMELLLEKLSERNSKVIVFMPNIKATEYFYELAREILGNKFGPRFPVLPLHGNLRQSRRNTVQTRFRNARSGVLISSNVGARGMDFPGVNCVIQLGVQLETASHTHRVGRTGRAGTTGESISILSKAEKFYAERLRKEGHVLEEIEKPQVSEAIESEIKSAGKFIRPDYNSLLSSMLGTYASVPRLDRDADPKALVLDCGRLYQAMVGGERLLQVSARDLDRFGVTKEDIDGVFQVDGVLKGNYRPRGNSYGNRNGNRSGNRNGYRNGNGSGNRNRDNDWNSGRRSDRNFGSRDNRGRNDQRRRSYDRWDKQDDHY